jgi:hypothetical protein
MASWTDQDTDSLLPGEPWTSAKALAAFENPVAIAEGAAGAPKIQTAAYGANSVNENAMKVLPEGESGDLLKGASKLVTIAGNLVFFPRVSGSGIVGSMTQGNLLITNTNQPPDEGPNTTDAYTVSWYRIVP